MKNRSKIKLLLLTLLMLMLASFPAQGAKLNKTKLQLTDRKKNQMVLKNTKKKTTWKSANKAIVTVTKKGKVTAKKVGTTKVTAKIGSKKYVCKITVKAKKSGTSSGSFKASAGVVYWTPGGTVYHLSRNCSTLSRSRTVYSGSISDSGKARVCKVCG